MQKLHVDNTKDKNEFVKYKIPKFIFQVLLLGDTKFTKYQFLNRFAQQDQTAVCSIDDGLKRRETKKKIKNMLTKPRKFIGHL